MSSSMLYSPSTSSSSIYDNAYARRSAYSSSPYSPGYSTTYGSSYGSTSSSIPSSSGSRLSSGNIYDKYYGSDDLKRDRFGSSRGTDYHNSSTHSGGSRYPSSMSTYTPRYLMNSDLLDMQRSNKNDIISGGRNSSSSSSSGYGSSGRNFDSSGNYDRLGRRLSNYDKWKLSQSGSSSDSTDLTSPTSAIEIPITLTGKPSSSSSSSTAAPSSGGRRRNKKRNAVRFSDVTDCRTIENDYDEVDDDSPVSALREMSMGPISSPSTDSGISSLRGSRSASMRPDLSSSSYRPSFGSPYSYSSSLSSPSSSYAVRSLPSGVADKLSGYDVQDVKGDGGCYYRCLSLYFTGSEGNYMKYRREVLDYIKQNLDNYSTMIRSELSGSARSTSDYFHRKTRADRQDWAETTEIIATCCVYNINVHVLALVPGRYSMWEWLHFDPSIGTGRPSRATRDIHLYNAGSVHFMLCTPKS